MAAAAIDPKIACAVTSYPVAVQAAKKALIAKPICLPCLFVNVVAFVVFVVFARFLQVV